MLVFTKKHLDLFMPVVIGVCLLGISGCGGASKAGPATEGADEPRYNVKFEREIIAGLKMTVSSKETNVMEVFVGDQAIQNQKSENKGSFVAIIHAVDRDDAGEIQRVEYLVETLVVSSDGQDATLISDPTVIVATRDEGGETILEAEEGELSAQIREALGEFISIKESATGVGDDDIFGTKEPQSVGTPWSIQLDLAVKDAAESGIEFVPGTTQGDAKIESVKVVEGQDCMEVSAGFRGEISSGKMVPNLPPGATTKGWIDARFSGILPVDASKPRVSDKTVLNINLTVVLIKDGQQMTMKMTSENVESTQFTVVK